MKNLREDIELLCHNILNDGFAVEEENIDNNYTLHIKGNVDCSHIYDNNTNLYILQDIAINMMGSWLSKVMYNSIYAVSYSNDPVKETIIQGSKIGEKAYELRVYGNPTPKYANYYKREGNLIEMEIYKTTNSDSCYIDILIRYSDKPYNYMTIGNR